MFIKTCFLAGVMLLGINCFSQVLEIPEKAPMTDNGFEYGYVINNEQIKEAGGQEYSRYELTLYVTNKSGCTKLYSDRGNLFSSSSPNLLATFNCRNANGKRLTSKGGNVKVRDFYVTIKKMVDKKEVTESGKAGYIFRNNETLRDNIIVIVPKGERPQIQCTLNTLTELQ